MENGNAPATKADLLQVRNELKNEVAMLRSEMSHQYDDVKEAIEHVETKLLTAFYAFAE